MNGIDTIDRLLRYEKKAATFYWRSFIAIAVIAVSLLILNFSLGWIKDFGAAIGSTFVALLVYVPFNQVTKRKDHIEGLAILRASYLTLRADYPSRTQIMTAVMGRVQKMLEG